MNLMRAMKKWPIHVQLSLGVTLLLTVLSSLFTYDLVQKQERVIQDHYQEEAISTLRALSLLSANNILERDFAGLNETVHLADNHTDFLFSMIHLPNGKILMHSDPSKIGKFLTDERSKNYLNIRKGHFTVADTNAYLDMASPIVSNNTVIGFSRVAIDKNEGIKTVHELIQKSVLYITVSVFIVFLFSYFLTKLISNQLSQLISLARKIESGERDSRASLEAENEVGTLAKVFNSMLDSLQKDEQQLQESHLKLQKSEERFGLAIKISNDGLWDWDIITGEMYASPRCKEMLGYSENELMSGKNWVNIIHPDDVESHKEDMSQYLSGLKPFYSRKHRMRHKDGHYVWIFCRGAALKNDEGVFYRMVGMHTDITQELKVEAEKENLYNQLRQSQKMEAVGQLTGGIAHDFNNILAGIIGFTDLGLKRKNLDEKSLAHLFQISKLANRARELVRQMMIFSRGGDPDPKIVFISDTVDESLALLKPVLTNGIVITSPKTKLRPKIKIDQVQLQQVIMNLVINSRDAMKEAQGEINVEVNFTDCRREICSSCSHTFEGKWVELSIKDNGAGIEENVLKKIFEPFFSTKAPGKGTGMGLSMVHGIVHRHSGHIVVKSVPGKGTTFKIYFPEAQADEVVEVETKKNICQLESSKKRVLVVDDEDFIREFTAEFLEERGIEVFTAENGKAALEIIKNDERGFDLIISDYTMPEMDGIKLIENIRKILPNQLVILSSGNIDVALERDFKHLNINAVLVKPYDIDEAMDIISGLWSSISYSRAA